MDDMFDTKYEMNTTHDPKFDKQEMMEQAKDTKKVKYDYKPPNSLKLDDDIEQYFKSIGFATKWVNRSTRNIRRRLHPNEGYSFVDPSDLPADMVVRLGDVESYGPNASIITSGDVVLMKVPVEKNEARKDYYRDRTKSQADAINERLKQNNIDNSSKSVVRTGKNAHFSS